MNFIWKLFLFGCFFSKASYIYQSKDELALVNYLQNFAISLEENKGFRFPRRQVKKYTEEFGWTRLIENSLRLRQDSFARKSICESGLLINISLLEKLVLYGKASELARIVECTNISRGINSEWMYSILIQSRDVQIASVLSKVIAIDREELIYRAAEAGRLDILQYYLQSDCLRSNKFFSVAVRNEDIPIVRWCLKQKLSKKKISCLNEKMIVDEYHSLKKRNPKSQLLYYFWQYLYLEKRRNLVLRKAKDVLRKKRNLDYFE